jgi:glycyl-tRNA synthetase beta chain
MTDTQYKHLNQEDLLVELGCEELPPKALDGIRQAFFSAIKTGLEKQNFEFEADGSRSFSTPRRLAVLIRRVTSSQADQDIERRGPAVKAAFDVDGKPTGAAIGFARSVGKEVSDLETLSTDKGEWLFARQHVPGKSLAEVIFPMLEQAIKQLPVPKPMRWANHDFSFVRPVHWLVVMHGDEVYPGTLLGQNAADTTRGHRIHAPGPHRIPSVSDYCRVLQEAYVVADPEGRRELIRDKLRECSENVHIDPDLLDEVNNLVEWPVAIQCTFDDEFLAVPHEVLVASMQDHQKFFPVMESAGSEKISNHFITVANIESTHPSLVREGFERVIRPRLADARFFLQQDLKKPLESFFDVLDHVIFQNKLGTIGDKSRRISNLSKKIAEQVSVDPELSERASTLSKCDLMTQMVGEFPELQGVMGHHYSLASGEHPDVATAIEEHYAPRFAGDCIPSTDIGRVVGIADRLDTLVSIFAAGLRPSGNKDPFALRRAALGVVRILLEGEMALSLRQLLSWAANELAAQLPVDDELLEDIRGFVIERARNHYREQGFSAELVNAVIASDWDTLPDLDLRLKALSHFMGKDAASSLAAANKRIGNILRKSDKIISNHIDTDKLVLAEESSLFEEVISLEKQVHPLLEAADYAASLELLAGLRSTVDTFFDSVMVMDEDAGLRANRLALLARLKALFDRIADLSVLG